MKTVKRKYRPQKMGRSQKSELLDKYEDLRQQMIQLQIQMNAISLPHTQPMTRSSKGLHTLGIIFYYIFLPFHWVKKAFRMIINLVRWTWTVLRNPKFYWLGFYWLSFAWLVVLDNGLKDLLRSLRHPRHLARSIGLLQE